MNAYSSTIDGGSERDPEVVMSLFSSPVNRWASLETHVESLYTSTRFKLSPKRFKLSQIVSGHPWVLGIHLCSMLHRGG